MPTGYTSHIINDTLTKPSDFALICARAFGACIHQRDDSLNTEIKIPESEIEDYDKNLKEAQGKLKRLIKYTNEQKVRFGEKMKKKQVNFYKAEIKKADQTRKKLEKVREWAANWVPPTSEHHGLKKFMLEQIDSTIDFDGKPDYYKGELKSALNKSPMDFYKKELESAQQSINYYKEEKENEIKRVNERADWIKVLLESVK
jgi:hypothetical protein